VGVRGVGAGRTEAEANAPAVLLVKGTRIAFLSYTSLYPEGLVARGGAPTSAPTSEVGVQVGVPGVSDFNVEKIKQKIAELKEKKVDIMVALMHWGEEYQKKANGWQRETAAQLVAAGADLIVGTHAHVAQEVEEVKAEGEAAWVAYSLGNFVFDQKFSKETMRGLALKVTVRDKKIEKVEKLPVVINENFQPEISN